MRVYLAGPINGCTDREARAWRETVKSGLGNRGVEFLDPMSADYRGEESTRIATIVDGDKMEIDSCDLVFAYCWQPSFGAAMEIHYAHGKGIETWAVVEGKKPSPWLAYHARIFATLGDAMLALAARCEVVTIEPVVPFAASPRVGRKLRVITEGGVA